MERIRSVVEPLLGKEEVAQVGDRLRLRFDYVIADRLFRIVVIGNRQSRAAPILATQRVSLPTASSWFVFMNCNRVLRLDCQCPDLVSVIQKEPRVQIHRQHITGDADGHRPMIGNQRLLDISNLIGEQKLDAVSSGGARRNRYAGRLVPLLGILPFVFSVSLSMDHPCKRAFEGLIGPGGLVE